jgi:hypothetical protein
LLQKINISLFTSLLFLASCTPTAAPPATVQVITIYASPATQPWLSEVYACAQGSQFVLSNTADPAQAELSIRMGEPGNLKSPAYQIGSDDILIIANRESPLQNLTLEQAQTLFSIPGAATQVWVFAPGEDIQQVFTRQMMKDAVLTPGARLALSPQQMSDILNNDKGSVGLLPRRWKAGTVRDIFSLKDIPILALTKSEPQGALKELLGCLQKRPAQ